MWQSLLCVTAFLLSLAQTATGLWCYKCHSSQAGCGSELNIRLQRWHWCPDPGPGGYENFCVKVVEKVGSEQFITRECLETLEKDTRHRQQIPNVRRHNYCSPARSSKPGQKYNENSYYCFCNDWNGCNTASNYKARLSVVSLMGFMVILFLNMF